MNQTNLLGNLGVEPEITYFESGAKKAVVKLATSESWIDKTTGEKKEITTWHEIHFWGKVVDVIEKYVFKGSKIRVTGSNKSESWEDRTTGEKRFKYFVQGKELELISKPQNTQENYNQDQPVSQATKQESEQLFGSSEAQEDELPF